MKRYVVVLSWRQFTWTLRAWARRPADLIGLSMDAFGDEHVAMKIAPA